MKQRVVGKELREVDILQDVCDGCGQDLDWKQKREETAHVEFSFGYLSDKDGQHGKYWLCNYCSEQLYKLMRGQFPNMDKLKDTFYQEDIPDEV